MPFFMHCKHILGILLLDPVSNLSWRPRTLIASCSSYAPFLRTYRADRVSASLCYRRKGQLYRANTYQLLRHLEKSRPSFPDGFFYFTMVYFSLSAKAFAVNPRSSATASPGPDSPKRLIPKTLSRQPVTASQPSLTPASVA